MAYSRLLRAYYHHERGIPEGEAYRLARAVSKPQREAVDVVLREFFKLVDGVWIQKRADAEIQRYLDGEPEREIKKANETNRVKRHREERAALFKRLTDAGLHAPWNIGMTELRKLVETLPVTPETLQVPLHVTAPATTPATPATATQTPYPDTIPRIEQEPRAQEDVKPQEPTPLGLLCKAMVSAGFPAVRLNHSDPRLIALVDAGVTPDEAAAVVREGGAGKGIGWIAAAINGRRQDAAKPIAGKATPTKPREVYKAQGPRAGPKVDPQKLEDVFKNLGISASSDSAT